MNLNKLSVLLTLLPATFAEAVDFNQDIRPILSQKCFACHGPDTHDRKAKLQLDTAEGAYAARKDSNPAIVPGKPDESELIYRIMDDEDPMPPEDYHKPLTKKEKELMVTWVKEGAVYSKPWAYVKPEKHFVPTVQDTKWPKNFVDHFILKKLEEHNLKPVSEADKVTLVRRLYFDLTGLPPDWSIVEQFLADKITYSEIVEKLLDFPQFGERMAVYWLDLVRFADTVGYHGDQDHNISPYRDYVIRAFNLNLPFDQFTREQIAGDMLPNAGKWQKVASGYNRLLQTSHEGGIQAKEYNAIYAADRVRNVSNVWMAATMGCAQCHDHKFDPYTLKDHYSMAAFFADIPDTGFSGNSLPTIRPPEISFLSDSEEEQISLLRSQVKKLLGEDLYSKVGGKNEKAALSIIPSEKHKKWKEIMSQITSIQKQARKTMVSASANPRTIRVLPRGNWLDDSGPVVLPAIPEFLGELSLPDKSRANRLDLANWLVDSETGAGGFTARVFANRLWYLLFGKGLSTSLEDFGGQGTPPSHPKLLDSLSVYFYENGWDVKQLIRLLVHSRAYQLSSIPTDEVLRNDALNQLFSRQDRYRLGAEFIRDNALAIGGLLENKEIGGPSIKPYQPVGYYRHLNFPTRKYAHSKGESQYRRGLYVHWQRMFLHPMMKAMDAPSREECTAQRPRSNTPTSALVLLNDPTFLEAALAFGHRILKQAPASAEDRMDYAFNVALSRKPQPTERRLLLDLLHSTANLYKENPGTEVELLGNTGQATKYKDVDQLELVSWTAVARAILNLNETTTRN